MASPTPALPLGEVEAVLDRALQRMNEATRDFEVADDRAALERTKFTPRERVVMRVHEHGEDIVSLMPLVRELEARANAGQREAMDMLRGGRLQTGTGWGAHANLSRPTRTLAAAMKAMLFFVRAFADAAYAAVLVLNEKKANNATSMNGALAAWKKSATTHSGHHLPHLAIEIHAPGFFAWFEPMRDARNDFKSAAAGVGAEWHYPDPAEDISSLHVTVSGRAREGGIDRLTLVDIEEAVVWCTELAEVIKLEAERQTAKRVAPLSE